MCFARSRKIRFSTIWMANLLSVNTKIGVALGKGNSFSNPTNHINSATRAATSIFCFNRASTNYLLFLGSPRDQGMPKFDYVTCD